MSNFFTRLFMNALISSGARTNLIQQAAKRAARMERDFTGERLGVWAGATAKELQSDAMNAWNYVSRSLGMEAGNQQQESSASSSSSGKTGVGNSGSGGNGGPGRPRSGGH